MSVPSRVVIVTGGSAGLGRVMVLALLRDGHRVTAMGRSLDTLADLGRVAAHEGVHDHLFTVRGDIAQNHDCERAVADTIAHFGALDALINNAAVALPTHTPADDWKFWKNVSVEFWRQLVDINVNGAFQMAYAAAPHLVERGWGRIVNQITSHRTMIRAGDTPYGPSKAFVEAMTAAWADEFAGTGVTVNAILPGGAANTRMILESAFPDRSKLIDPDVMAAPTRWLLSPASDTHTGMRLTASAWDPSASDDANIARACEPAGWKPLLASAASSANVWPPR